jgi:hypothetical protein
MQRTQTGRHGKGRGDHSPVHGEQRRHPREIPQEYPRHNTGIFPRTQYQRSPGDIGLDMGANMENVGRAAPQTDGYSISTQVSRHATTRDSRSYGRTQSSNTDESRFREGSFQSVFASQSSEYRQPLSFAADRFAREVAVRDFTGIARFLAENSSILVEDDTEEQYRHATLAAWKVGDMRLVASYIEKLVVLHHVRRKTLREVADYLSPLAKGNDEALRKYMDEQAALRDRFRRQAEMSVEESTPARITRAVSDLKIGEEARGLSTGLENDGSGLEERAPIRNRGVDSRQLVQEIERASNERPTKPIAGAIKHGLSDDERNPREDFDDDEFSLGRAPSFRGDSVPKAKELERVLDPSYKRLNPRESGKFFVRGRVFSMLHHSEQSGPNIGHSKWQTSVMGITIFSSIGRFIVVKEGHRYCWCIPITTYSGQGVKKRGLSRNDVDAHAIVFSTGQIPERSEGEPMLKKHPIEIIPGEKNAILAKMSRINFAKVHTVE